MYIALLIQQKLTPPELLFVVLLPTGGSVEESERREFCKNIISTFYLDFSRFQ